MEKLISQEQLAEKYKENRCQISTALINGGVYPVQMSEKKHPVKLYNEYDAVMALVAYYNKRAEGHIDIAKKWQTSACNVLLRYRGEMK